MKRIGISTGLGFLALALSAASLVACERNIPVDDPDENPAIPGPKGIIRGAVNYFGPAPCFRNGEVEGQVVILLFDAANPPPPDGLASTALNFATVPGNKLFANVAPPPRGQPGGAGNNTSFCPSVDSPPISVTSEWSMQQVNAGRYQVRAFYNRLGRWNPLFNFANLAIAGDVPGGAFVNPRDPLPRFATIEVGVPEKPGSDKLRIPDVGFVREGVALTLAGPLRSNRPYFHIDVGASNGYDALAPEQVLADFATNYDAQRKRLTPEQMAANGFITFPQDHLSTSETNALCLGNKDPSCDAFLYAQASFPQIRFKYGFPGNVGAIGAGREADAWLAKFAKPSDPFFKDRVRPYYNMDPNEFAADIPTSNSFVLSRVFNAKGEPEILRDNETLEQLAKIAEIFPSVVLSKLVDDGEGGIAMPPRSQTDPIVVIQTITVKDWPAQVQVPDDANPGKCKTVTPPQNVGSMKATSEGAVIGGGLTDCLGNDADPTSPLASRTGVVTQPGFTALVRPSAVCIYPQDEFRGTLTTPVQLDPNPRNDNAVLVSKEKILVTRANRVKQVVFGCLPPGHYSVNVVYPTGQAWSFPNLSGHCSYTARFEPNEDCMNLADANNSGRAWLTPFAPPFSGPVAFNGIDPNRGFPSRPLLKSQAVFQTNPDGTLKLAPDHNGKMMPVPQVVVIKPSARCGSYQVESDLKCNADADCKSAPYKGACMASPKGGKACDVNGDGKISTVKIWVNNPENEDITLGNPSFDANGKLNPGEDKNGNAKLDLHVPFACSLPRDKWATLPAELVSK